MIKTMNEADARRDFDNLLLDVATTRRSVIIESDGESKVAIVPMQILDDRGRRRAAFFEFWQATAERINLPEDESMELALKAVAAVRAEARAAKRSVIE